MPGASPTHLRAELSAQADLLNAVPLTLVVAPGGYGKTTLAKRWHELLDAKGHTVVWLTLSGLHADPTLFLEDLLEAIRAVLPKRHDHESAFGESVERLLSNRVDLRPDRLARELGREFQKLSRPPILFLDAFEHLPRESDSLEFVDALLRLDPCPLHLVLTTRGIRPSVATRLLAADRAREVSADDLNLRAEQLEAMLQDADVEPTPDLVAGLLAQTEGWAIAIRLAVRALVEIPRKDRLHFVRQSGAQRDLFTYIATELLGRVSPQVVSLLEMSALLGSCSKRSLVEAAALEDGSAAVEEAIDAGLLTAEGDRLAVHDLWREWLGERMRSRGDGEQWRAAHERAGIALETAGEAKRAMGCYVAALPKPGLEDRIIQLLSDRGDRWVSQGHRRLVEDALAAVSEDRRKELPELIALHGLLLSGSDPSQAITHLKAAARAYHEAGKIRAEFMCLHEMIVVAMNENRVDETRAVYRRALTLRRMVTDPSIRGLVFMGLGAGAMLSGRYRMALRLTDVARTFDHHPRERGGIGIVQSSILFQMGDWDDASKRIQALLARPEQRLHGLSFHALQVVQALIDSARDKDPEGVRSRLEAAGEAFAAAHQTLNQLLTAHALARHDQHAGDDASAARNFERATALAASVEFIEAAASASGCLARVRQRGGDTEGAREAARHSLALLDRPEAWSPRRGRMLAWASGVALACCVLSELGEADRALRFLAKHRHRLEHRELPLSQHAVLTCIARAQSRGGKPSECEKTLREAWRFAEKANLGCFSPDLDAELLEWSCREARAIGLKGESLVRCLERFETKESPAFVLRSFGGLAVEFDGRRVPDRMWRGATPRRLLMRLLAADGQAVTRARIEADLWPDMTSGRARSNLRVAISRLRDVLERRHRRDSSGALLDLDGDRVGLSAEAVAAWDVTHWRNALERARAATEAGDEGRAIESVRVLASMSQAGFLPESYDDWAVDQRRSLETTLVEAGRALAASWQKRGGFEVARSFARLVLVCVPADEPSWEVLVAAYLDSGDRSGAIRAYEDACVQLRRELDATPGAALRELATRAGVTDRSPADPASQSEREA